MKPKSWEKEFEEKFVGDNWRYGLDWLQWENIKWWIRGKEKIYEETKKERKDILSEKGMRAGKENKKGKRDLL